MNYRHAFHAGNFADVFKHVLLTRILAYLMRKEAPLRFIDTHAGTGWYDLGGDAAQRTGEWRDGIGRLRGAIAPEPAAALLQPYFDIACADPAARYPGSPAIAAAMLRPLDRMIFCELHPADATRLRRAFARDRRAKAIELDGYTGLRAYVPPVERRGLVLIDPPFEDGAEFTRLAAAVIGAWRKWSTGTYAIWYPVKSRRDCEIFFKELVEGGVTKILRLELAVRRPGEDGPLAATGLAVVNPPYVLEDEARVILPWLRDVLAQGEGAGWRIERIAFDEET